MQTNATQNKRELTAAAFSPKEGLDSACTLQDNRPQAIVQQKQADALRNKSGEAPIQRKGNTTGLPDNLKSGIENLSGHSMDDVKVHYNSSQPAQLNAHAYAQGTDIHIASGQEKHLPHEAWHVVQQKQGRVKPTMQMKGKVNVNDDEGLEKEADVMGAKALQLKIKPAEEKNAGQYCYKPVGTGFRNFGDTAQLQHVIQFVFPRTATLYGESVYVTNQTEYTRAQYIIRTIKSRFGIELDSEAGVAAIQAQYTQAPVTVLGGLAAGTWNIETLESLFTALEDYRPILGPQRATSSRSAMPQEITTMSRVNHDITADDPMGVAGTAYGEFLSGGRNVSIFDESEATTDAFTTTSEEISGTATHEIAHGLLEHELPGYIAALQYWTDRNTPSGIAGAEAPPTAYGETNASEDFCESVMLYFRDRARLQNGTPGMGGIPAAGTAGNPCPVRDGLIHAIRHRF